jgi:hypothetical protein
VIRLFLFLSSVGILSVKPLLQCYQRQRLLLSSYRGDSSSTFLKSSNQQGEEILPEATISTMKARTAECFRDKTVLLTGASGGLGRSLALELAACGVGTLVLSARREDALEGGANVSDICQHNGSY